MDDLKDFVTIRPYIENDKNFILNSWLYGFKEGCEYFRLIEKDAYKDKYGQVIHNILERESTDIKIICLKEDQNIIVGYSITELRPPFIILHWMYVKQDWRNNGIARMLVPEGLTHATHLTKIGKALLKRHPDVSFNPFLI